MPDYTKDNTALQRYVFTTVFVAAFFVSPLIFFTNLTRNPYFFQITLLNVSLLAGGIFSICAALKNKTVLLQPNILNLPLAFFCALILLGFARSYASHEAFFQPSMLSEFLKAGLFVMVNCALVFLLAQKIPFSTTETEPALGGHLAFIFGWGILWLLYPGLRTTATNSPFWDPYGFCLWAFGIITALYLLRRFNQDDFFHLILSVGILASCYGALQYFRVEFIWPKLLNPYGNRSVSSFGNPNFISSYIVMLLPFALSRLMAARSGLSRFYYGFAFFSYLALLMASLTRSSWIGAIAAIAVLFAISDYRQKLRNNKKFLTWIFACAALLILSWPSQNLKPLSSGLLDRLSEGAGKMSNPHAVSLAIEPARVYQSFHQRLLIWTSAWQMGAESPLMGKGWGLFENFYPFYQGNLLFHFAPVRTLRTHANNAHNEILEIFSQTGLLGLGAYVWIFTVLFSAFANYRRRASQDEYYRAAPFVAAIAGMFADNLFNVSLHFAVPAALFWWITGAFSKKLSEPAPVNITPIRQKSLMMPVLLALLTVFAAALWYWQGQFSREINYFNGFKAMRRDDFVNAVSFLKKAYNANGREVNNNYELANAYFRSGDLKQAQWAYQEALKANAGYDEIYFNMAIVQKKLGAPDAALSSLKTSACINPLGPQVFNAMGEIYIKEPARYAKEAAEVFSGAAIVHPTDATILNTLGYFYSIQKNYAAAKAAYADGVRANPGNTMLSQNLLGTVAQMGLKNDPDALWLAKFNDVKKRLNSGDFSAASRRTADELILLEPENIHARALRAGISYKAGDLLTAKQDLLKVLKEAPQDNNLRYGLAVIYEKEGNKESAIAELSKILQSEPGNTSVRAHLLNLSGSDATHHTSATFP